MKRTGGIIVCVGSGVINDLCKYVSFQHGQQYMCVATAASMDGYASSGAVMTKDGAKINVETHAPIAIVADSVILAEAPTELTAAGYADLAAKIPASAEWLIADAFGTEPIIPQAWEMLVPVLVLLWASWSVILVFFFGFSLAGLGQARLYGPVFRQLEQEARQGEEPLPE